MEAVYLNKNPSAKAILELVRSADADRICYDHFAFRTFGVMFVLKLPIPLISYVPIPALFKKIPICQLKMLIYFVY